MQAKEQNRVGLGTRLELECYQTGSETCPLYCSMCGALILAGGLNSIEL